MPTWGAKRKRSGYGGSGRGASWKRGRRAGVYKRWSRRRGAAGTRTGEMRVRRTCNALRTASDAVNTIFAIPNGLQNNGLGLIFQINDLPGYTDFVTLFDEYRINSLTYRFMPRFNVSEAAYGGAQSAIPTFITAVDDDGAFQTTTLGTMLQYGNARIRRGNQPIVVKFQPCAFGAVQTSSTTVANQAKLKGKWFALGSGSTGASVDFYGLAIFAELPGGYTATSSSQYEWDVYVTADVSFRKTL